MSMIPKMPALGLDPRVADFSDQIMRQKIYEPARAFSISGFKTCSMFSGVIGPTSL